MALTNLSFNHERPFALIKRRTEDEILILEGESLEVDQLSDIPRKTGASSQGAIFDTVSMIPFRQVTERGFQAHDGGEKILCLQINKQQWNPIEEFISLLPQDSLSLEKEIQYDSSPEEYENIIRAIVNDEIGNGEGANFVISRKGEAKIANMSIEKVLSFYRNLLLNEMGSYWKFLFYDGKRYFVGATPERHISVHQGQVKMNPISGTYRKKPGPFNRAEFRKDFLSFLNDQKEINELFMVVDEELKMMARFCGQGGIIIGPLLKEMSKLIHTEYLLAGKSSDDIIDLLRDSMYAATVTGSPVENACKIICKYEKEPRSYYASAITLIGRDEEGEDTLDSPITIRTLEIDQDGSLLLRVGATLVRDSTPSEEVEETLAKIAGVRGNIENPPSEPPQPIIPRFEGDDEIHIVLQQRNQYLSKFWFFNQEDTTEKKTFSNYLITIIDNEDDFCLMMRHMLNSMGTKTKVVRYTDYDFDQDDASLVIIGPGPGNPNDLHLPKMKKSFDITKKLLASNRPFMSVCLGHQLLCLALGMEVIKKEYPFQGVQEKIDLFGQLERVGYYNTFAGRYRDSDTLSHSIEASYSPDNSEVHAIRSQSDSHRFIGFQFHSESILTQNGYDILKQTIQWISSN